MNHQTALVLDAIIIEATEPTLADATIGIGKILTGIVIWRFLKIKDENPQDSNKESPNKDQTQGKTKTNPNKKMKATLRSDSIQARFSST